MRDHRLAPPWSLLQAEHIPADFAPANLALFGDTHAYRPISGLLPAIAGRTYDGVRHLIPLFDPRAYSPAALIEGLTGFDCYFPVPSQWLDGFAAEWRFDQRDTDSDYLYDAQGIRELAGPVRRGRRNLALRFEQQHRPSTASLDAAGEGAALTILDGWLADVGKAAGDTDWPQARAAIARRNKLGLRGRVIRCNDGMPAGFLLASLLEDCAIIHFAKGRRALEGVYPYMFRDFACSEPALRWLNFEQDLGNPGFPRNKTAFGPDTLLQKYRAFPVIQGKAAPLSRL